MYFFMTIYADLKDESTPSTMHHIIIFIPNIFSNIYPNAIHINIVVSTVIPIWLIRVSILKTCLLLLFTSPLLFLWLCTAIFYNIMSLFSSLLIPTFVYSIYQHLYTIIFYNHFHNHFHNPSMLIPSISHSNTFLPAPHDYFLYIFTKHDGFFCRNIYFYYICILR